MFFETYAVVEEALRKATGEDNVLITDGGDHADLASTVAFSLAKSRRMNPAALASEIASQVKDELSGKGIGVEVKGPYINFIFGEKYLEDVITEALKEGYGSLPQKPGRICLEHTSANPNQALISYAPARCE